MKAGGYKRGLVEEIAAVEEDRRSHERGQFAPGQIAILRPRSDEHKRVCVGGQEIDRFGESDTRSALAPGAVEGNGVVCANVGAALQRSI